MAGPSPNNGRLEWLKDDLDSLSERLDQRDQRIWEAIDALREEVRKAPSYQQPCSVIKKHLQEHEKRADRWWQLALKLVVPALGWVIAGLSIGYAAF